MTGRRLLLGFFILTLLVPPSALAQPETLTIAAANSVKDALRKMLPLFEAEHPHIAVRVIYGPSQTLRKQIRINIAVGISYSAQWR